MTVDGFGKRGRIIVIVVEVVSAVPYAPPRASCKGVLHVRLACRFLVCLLLALPATLAASEKWIEVTSPNFRVISNGSERQARDVAMGFEQMRAVFPKVLLNIKTETPKPIVILAVRDGASLARFDRSLVDTAGFFTTGKDDDLVVVRLEIQDWVIPYHGYIQHLLDLNFERLPLWLSERPLHVHGELA